MTQSPLLEQCLQQKRIELDIDLRDIENETKISKAHLIAIEKKNFKALPPEVYTKNIIRNYSDFLKISDEQIIQDYINEYTNFIKKENESEKIKKYLQTKRKKIIDIPKIIKILLITIILGTSIVYLGWGIKKIFDPPLLQVISPANNIKTSNQSILVKGKTKPGTEISINNSVILVDELGDFEKEILLKPGINLIEIKAKNKHGKENNITKQILFEITESKDKIN